MITYKTAFYKLWMKIVREQYKYTNEDILEILISLDKEFLNLEGEALNFERSQHKESA